MSRGPSGTSYYRGTRAADRRVMRHRGHKKAVVVVALTILVIIYHLLKDQVPYQELGATYLDRRNRKQATRQYVKPLERLGHRVLLEPVA